MDVIGEVDTDQSWRIGGTNNLNIIVIRMPDGLRNGSRRVRPVRDDGALPNVRVISRVESILRIGMMIREVLLEEEGEKEERMTVPIA